MWQQFFFVSEVPGAQFWRNCELEEQGSKTEDVKFLSTGCCHTNLQLAGPLSSARAQGRARGRREGGSGRLSVEWRAQWTHSWLATAATCTAAHNPQLAVGTLNLVQHEHYAAILLLHKYHLCLWKQIWPSSSSDAATKYSLVVKTIFVFALCLLRAAKAKWKSCSWHCQLSNIKKSLGYKRKLHSGLKHHPMIV